MVIIVGAGASYDARFRAEFPQFHGISPEHAARSLTQRSSVGGDLWSCIDLDAVEPHFRSFRPSDLHSR
jgi:hypothetical protein